MLTISNSKLFFQMSIQVYSCLDQTEDEERPFLESARREGASWDFPQEHLFAIRDERSLSFCKIQNNPSPSLLFIRPPYK